MKTKSDKKEDAIDKKKGIKESKAEDMAEMKKKKMKPKTVMTNMMRGM